MSIRRAFALLTCSTFTSGNANALATNVANKLKYTIDGWAIRQDLVFFYGEAEKRVNANFWNGGLRAERRLMPRLGMFFATRDDRNALQGISSRFEEALRLGISLPHARRATTSTRSASIRSSSSRRNTCRT